MNALQKTLAIIALLALASQTIRHAYRLWLEPRGSVLDKYDQPLKGAIEGASSLDELVARYDKVRKEADAKREELRQNAGQKAGKDKPAPYALDESQEPFKSEHELHDAITDWEKKSAEIHELRFYWLVGLVILLVGIFAYKKLGRWFGMSLLILAFSEFIYWTSPTFFGPGTQEYDRLLINKLAFSAASLILLLLVIRSRRIFTDQREQSRY